MNNAPAERICILRKVSGIGGGPQLVPRATFSEEKELGGKVHVGCDKNQPMTER